MHAVWCQVLLDDPAELELFASSEVDWEFLQMPMGQPEQIISVESVKADKEARGRAMDLIRAQIESHREQIGELERQLAAQEEAVERLDDIERLAADVPPIYQAPTVNSKTERVGKARPKPSRTRRASNSMKDRPGVPDELASLTTGDRVLFVMGGDPDRVWGTDELHEAVWVKSRPTVRVTLTRLVERGALQQVDMNSWKLATGS